MRKFRFFTTLFFNISIVMPTLYMMISETSKMFIDSDYARLEGIFAGGFYIVGLILQLIAFIPTLVMLIIFLSRKEDGIVSIVFTIVGSVVGTFLSMISIVPMTLVDNRDNQGWLVLLFLATITIIIINVVYMIMVIANRRKSSGLQNPSEMN